MFNEIFDQFQKISLELDMLQEDMAANIGSLEDCRLHLEKIDAMISNHHKTLRQYAKRFRFKIDPFVRVYLDEAWDFIKTAINYIVTKTQPTELDLKFLLTRKFHHTHLYLCWHQLTGAALELRTTLMLVIVANGVWDERYQEELECWGISLKSSDVGLPLSRSTIVLQNREEEDFLQKQVIAYALYAEKLFFAVERNRNARVPEIMEDLRHNRTTSRKTRTLDFNQTSGRTIISSTIGSAQRDLAEINPEDLTNSSTISENLGWKVRKTKNWNWETVKRGSLPYKKAPRPLSIKYQFQPLSNQLLNFHNPGVGRYGSVAKSRGTPNILTVINSLTQNSEEKERLLAEFFLRYKAGDSEALSYSSLFSNGFALPKSIPDTRILIGRINKAAYLVCFQEVYRRGIIPYDMPQLPFGVAVACALRLIADGHLNMAQVFDSDAPYGVFSGTSVMGTNLRRTTRKFYNLLLLFCNIYTQESYDAMEYENELSLNDGEEGEVVIFGPEHYHQLLRESDGGGEDSDGEEYDIPRRK